jgi:protein tyrosine phosphatase (PTP) superfamily phosphohydrolase (DUF442 family)
MSTKDILNFRKVNPMVVTGGQPSEAQLESAALEGFQVVINLATLDPEKGLPDEEGLVHRLGMDYYHIPVEWENPRSTDFEAFQSVMETTRDKKLLIHCAANYRVTTFYALYALRNLGWSEPQADEFRSSIWTGSNYPIWEAFYTKLKAKYI